MEKMYSVMEVASMFGVTRGTVFLWMKAGRLPFVWVGGRRRITESAVNGFIRPGVVQQSHELQAA